MVQKTLAHVSSCALIVLALWNSAVVEAEVLSKYFDVMRCILTFSSSGLSLSKERSGFSVTNNSYKSTGYEESTESSLVEAYISVGT